MDEKTKDEILSKLEAGKDFIRKDLLTILGHFNEGLSTDPKKLN